MTKQGHKIRQEIPDQSKNLKIWRGSGGRLGPQSGCRGEVPGGGLGATPPDAEVFLLFVIQKVPLKCI